MALGFDPQHDPDELLIDVSERPSRFQRLLDASAKHMRALLGASMPWQQKDEIIPVQVDLLGEDSGANIGLTPDHPFRNPQLLAQGDSSTAVTKPAESWSFNEPVLLRPTGRLSKKSWGSRTI